MRNPVAGIRRFWRIDAAGLAVLAALTAAAYLLQIHPLVQQHRLREMQETDLAGKYRRITLLQGSLRSADAQLASVQQSLARTDLRLIPAGHLNERVGRLTDIAGEAGIQIDGVEPGKAIATARYQTVGIRLNGRGTYRNCARFIRNLSEMLRDSSITHMQLAAQHSDAETKATFVLDLLWYTAPGDVLSRQ